MRRCTADSECGCEECTTTCQGCGCYGYEIVWYDGLRICEDCIREAEEAEAEKAAWLEPGDDL